MENNNLITIYLKPGEMYVSCDPVKISSVLGSCVAVCLYDKVNKIGGANHYMLPKIKDDKTDLLRYGDHAIPELINAMLKEGANKRYIVAKVVGGCNSSASNIVDIGKQNLEIAREILRGYGIPIIEENGGGKTGRVIKFYTYSNELSIRQAGDRKQDKKTADVTPEKFVNLSFRQSQYLKEKFFLGVERVDKVLTTMFNCKVDISIEEVTIRKIGYVQNYIKNKFSNFIVNTGQKSSNGIIGEVVIFMDSKKVDLVINDLLKRPLSTSVSYNRLETSVVTELSNIMINAMLGTLANELNFELELKVPELKRSLIELNSLTFMQKSKSWKIALALKASLNINKGINSLLLIIAELNLPSYFFKKIDESN